MSKVFISYAHKDSFFVDRLREDLKRRSLPFWIDHEGLSPGTPSWERAIRQALKDCESVLWIVSPSSYESAYVRDEISIARMYKRTVYPVWADGANWLECVPLGTGEIQYVDARHDYTVALNKILDVIGKSALDYAVPDAPTPLLAPGVEPRNPYKGLAAFTERDRGDFFGREALVQQLCDALAERLLAGRDRFMALLGPSGAGKSSVVMAGVIPALQSGRLSQSAAWTYLPPIVPGQHPVEALADALYKAMPDKSLSALENDLNSPGGRMLHRLVRPLAGERVLLYVDQFEELFTLTENPAERQQFIDLMAQAVTETDGKLIVLLTMRAEFYGHPMHYPQLGALVSANNYDVLPMTISELWEAVEKPARLPGVGLTFDDGLAAEIIFALRERDKALAGALPLLEFTLARLFAQRHHTRLTFATYRALGGVEGAIGAHCESVFEALPLAAQQKLGAVFLPLLTIDEDNGKATRRRSPLETLTADSDARTLIDALVNNRLLQTGRDGDQLYIEVTHESLFLSWERLVRWIETTRQDLRLFRQYERDAKIWAERGKDTPQPTHEALIYLYKALANLDIAQNELTEPLKSYSEPEQNRLLRELDTLPETAEMHSRRRDIGDRLAVIGDTRPGVGLRDDGLPDIEWLPVEGSGKIVEFQDQGGKVYGKFAVQPFYIAKYMVTYDQYQAFVEAADGFKNAEWWKGMSEQYQQQELNNQRTKSLNNPRDTVSWYQSVAFVRWLDAKLREAGLLPDEKLEVRLPTEWEWQWAAQAGEAARAYPWGEWKDGYANTSEAGLGRAVAVGLYPHGAAACGALDMSGNLWEWCLNEYQNPDKMNISGDARRVLRGGSFNLNQVSARAVYRDDGHPVNRDFSVGFRVVRVPPSP